MHAVTDKLPRIEIATVPEDVCERLFNELREFFHDADEGRVEQRAPEPPAWIQILANVIDWTIPFKAAATVYLSTWAKLAAEAHWRNRDEIRRSILEHCSNAVAPLRRLSSAIFTAKDAIPSPRFAVGLAIPGPGQFLTEMQVSTASKEEFIEQVSLFVANVEGIRRASHSIRLDDLNFKVFCYVTHDKITLRWQAGDYSKHERDFDFSGEPLGDSRPYCSPAPQA